MTMGLTRRLAASFVGLVAALSLGLPATGAWGAPRGTLVVAQGGEVDTLDPQMQEQVYAHTVVNNIFDFLVLRVFENDRLQHKPMLATSWETTDDRTWVFHLRKGVRFHNGEEFNAEAVKFNLERVLNPAQKAKKRYYFTDVERVETPDPYTVKIITKKPMPTLLVNLGFGLPMMPPRYVREKGDAHVATHPVGTGPFKFVRWRKDEEIVLEAAENYWGGPPNIKTVVFKPIPEDSTRAAALLGGSVDIVRNVPVHLARMVNESKRAQILSSPSALSTHIFLDTLKPGPLQDKRVRQALNYGVDKEAIIRQVLEGNGRALGSPLTPFHLGYDASSKPYPYDPEKAMALLREAGVGGGLQLTLHSPSGRYEKDKEFAEAIAGQLEKIGVRVQVQVYEWGTYMKKLYSPEGGGPLFVVGWAGNFDADGILYPTLHCGTPLSKWCNKEFDRSLDLARSTLDPKERDRLYSRATRLSHDEAPLLFLWYGYNAYGVSHRVQNWKPTPDENRAIYLHRAGASFPSVTD